MGKWVTINQPYGKRHIPPAGALGAVGAVEQFADGRELLCEVWGKEEITRLEPEKFRDLRSAKKFYRERYLAPNAKSPAD